MKLDDLVARVRASRDEETRDAALELVKAVMDLHAEGIDRMMELTVESGDAGWTLIDRFGGDTIVSNLLLLHGLHPVQLEDRVTAALESVRPYLLSHGGNVELIDVSDGVVRLRLIGSCNGCPSSALTLKSAIETAIYESAPDVAAIVCEGAQPQSPLLSLGEAA